MPGSDSICLTATLGHMLPPLQALCFMPGATSIFDGDKLPTPPTNARNEARAMFEPLGPRSRPAFLPYGAGNESSATDFAAAAGVAGEAGGGCRGDGGCGGSGGCGGGGHKHHHHHGEEHTPQEHSSQGQGAATLSAQAGGGCGGRGACGGHQHAVHA